MKEFTPLNRIEEAVQYFQGKYGELKQKPLGSDLEIDLTKGFLDYIYVAEEAATRVKGYGAEQLGYLKENGFAISASTLSGDSMATVIQFVTVAVRQRDKMKVSKDQLQQAMLVLTAYQQIHQYELQVAEHRKLHAVDEAMRERDKRERDKALEAKL